MNLQRWLPLCTGLLLFGPFHHLLADERPNIVLILADDLGYTDLGCYGSKYYETPHIDRLAAQGVRFTDGYTCGPNCQPTRAALMSGQYGPRTGIYTVGSIERFNWRSRPLRPVDNVVALSPSAVTIAEALKQAGYATAMFGKWHLGNDPEHHPLNQGFDQAVVSQGRHFHFTTIPRVAYPEGTYLADFLTDRAVEFIRQHKDRPFFLFLSHFAVHTPLQAKAELVERFRHKPPAGGHKNPVYAAMIASLDESVGRVVQAIDEAGIARRTLVIFTSDNGGVGGYQREGIRAQDITDNRPLRGGKGMLYEGGIRVPFIFRWTGTIPPGTLCRRPINSVDLYPTFLELADAPAPEGHVLDGVSFAEALRHPDDPRLSRRPPLYWHFPGYLGSGGNTWRTTPVGVVREGAWKLMEFFEDGHLELYNLEEDLGETKNLAEMMPERAQKMHQMLQSWRQAVGAPMPTPNREQNARGNPGKKKQGARRNKGGSL